MAASAASSRQPASSHPACPPSNRPRPCAGRELQAAHRGRERARPAALCQPPGRGRPPGRPRRQGHCRSANSLVGLVLHANECNGQGQLHQTAHDATAPPGTPWVPSGQARCHPAVACMQSHAMGEIICVMYHVPHDLYPRAVWAPKPCGLRPCGVHTHAVHITLLPPCACAWSAPTRCTHHACF